MKGYWLYRVLFFGAVALSIGLVVLTVSGRQRTAVRAESAAASRAPRARNVPPDLLPPPLEEGTSSLTSRVRITTVIPFRREIQLHNFGDAAQDLGGWMLVSPRPGAAGDDRFTIPLGVVLLPGESLIVLVDEGVDSLDMLHWRAPAEQRVLEPSGDTVVLLDDTGVEMSRFTYLRR